jgi:hypothetical protein
MAPHLLELLKLLQQDLCACLLAVEIDRVQNIATGQSALLANPLRSQDQSAS